MAHFFCDAVSGSEAVLLGEEAKHIARVLRMREGERLTVSTPDGMEHDCVIVLSSPEQVLLTVERSYPNETEPQVKVTLAAFPSLKIVFNVITLNFICKNL